MDKEQVDEVVGGFLYADQCPRCEKRGCLTITYSQKMTDHGLLYIRIVDCSNCWYHKEIPLYDC